MAKPIKSLAREVKDENELYKLLEDFSKDGLAWVYSVMPFSHSTTFHAYKNPSSVPDYWHDSTHGRIWQNGKMRGFTHAAIIREQNRGITCQ